MHRKGERPMTIGSSPLARGLPRNLTMLPIEARIIPARAGFTSVPGAHHHPHQDHPRSRGVYNEYQSPAGVYTGSSPLARGLPVDEPDARVHDRIIPARAGFTPSTHWVEGTLRDHPRSRGVYEYGGGRPLDRRWIIPARAGFTPPATSGTRSWEDHPRSRGVYRRGDTGPRGRGRIIPARAGFTFAFARLWGIAQDHPRSRGVYK